MANRDAAAVLLTQVFDESTRAFAAVGSLRLVASKITPEAQSSVAAEAAVAADLFATDSGLQEAFGSNAPLVVKALGGLRGVAEQIAAQHVRSCQAVIDAASLVFAHSVLDSAVYQYCRVSAMAQPCDWERFAADRKVTLADVRNRGYEGVLELKVQELVLAFERESLPKKIQRLFAICQPLPNLPGGFSYSSERLEDLDKLRHALVHGYNLHSRIPELERATGFLQATNYLLYNMVMTRYRLPFRADILMSGTSGEAGA